MTTILLAGLGAVGVRAARQLVDTSGVDRVLLAARSWERARRAAEALGQRADAVRLAAGEPLPAGVSAVATALPSDPDAEIATRAVRAGIPVVSSGDDRHTIATLLELDPVAREAGVTVGAGCGLAPGLADVLARHAAVALDSADEANVARSGVAGPASRAAARRSRHERPVEWRDRTWHERRRHHAEIVWFPEPVGARECQPVTGGLDLLVRALPRLERATARLDEPPRRSLAAALARRRRDDGWGAVRVEVWGHRLAARELVTYGVIERTAVATGTVLAVTAACIAGAAPDVADGARDSGTHGLAEIVEPTAFLAELARRGVKAAVFEGALVG